MSSDSRRLTGVTKADLCDLANTRWEGSTKDFAEFGQSLNGAQYTDQDFVAGPASLWTSAQNDDEGLSGISTAAVWKRLSDLINGTDTSGAEKYYGNPQPTSWSFLGRGNLTLQSVQQRGLGDCYYLSTLAEWARYPNRWSLYAQGYNEELGYATYRYFVGGDIRYITVDDLIPFHNYASYEVFQFYFDSVGPQGALWAVLAEKSFAKLNVNYVNIIGGNFCPVKTDTFSGPCHTYDTGSMTDDQIWEIVKNATDNQWFLSAGTQSGSNSENNQWGVVLGHQYTLMGAFECGSTKVMKLRNPWGSHDYSAWNQSSEYYDGITTSCRQTLECTQNSSVGIFCTTLDIFRQSWASFSVAPYNENYDLAYYKVDTSAGTATGKVNFTVSEAGPYWFGAQFPTGRVISTLCDGYPSLSLTLMQKGGSALATASAQYSNWVFGSNKEPVELAAGDYIISYSLNPSCAGAKSAGLWVYGPEQVTLQKYVPTQSENNAQFNNVCAGRTYSPWYGINYGVAWDDPVDANDALFCFDFAGQWGCKQAVITVTLNNYNFVDLGDSNVVYDSSANTATITVNVGDAYHYFAQKGGYSYSMSVNFAQCS